LLLASSRLANRLDFIPDPGLTSRCFAAQRQSVCTWRRLPRCVAAATLAARSLCSAAARRAVNAWAGMSFTGPRPEASAPSPPGCDCPEYQPIAERIARVTETAPFESYSANKITVACTPASVLLAGGCAHQDPLLSAVHDPIPLWPRTRLRCVQATG
jgi:hypothetical protein